LAYTYHRNLDNNNLNNSISDKTLEVLKRQMNYYNFEIIKLYSKMTIVRDPLV